jgi:hypothetical protein
MSQVLTVPYITAWSTEQDLPATVIERRGFGIAYADETSIDRDGHGVLWYRSPSRPGQGRPEFGQVHSLRQRRAMRRLLCQVCAGAADKTADGVLWLLRDYRDDWANWPEGMGVTEPPVCLPCVRMSVRLCPALRKGATAVRVRHCPVSGVQGVLYQSNGVSPVAVGDSAVAFEDPAIRWVRAMNLVRELRGCIVISLTELTDLLADPR